MIPTKGLTISFFLLTAEVFAANAPLNSNSPQIPFAFAENRGQADPRVRFTGNGPEFKAWFEDRAVILQQGQTAVIISFVDGADATIEAAEPTGAKVSYLRGSDPRRWQPDLPLFASLRYSGIWPGVELTYKADRGRVKAEYLVSPGAPVDRIRLHFDGDARVQPDGTLRIRGSAGDFIEEKPVLFQTIGGQRKEIPGGFQKIGGSIGFWAGEHDHGLPLVIDPSILFSGYFGGSSQDNITAVAVDINRNVVIAGWTSSTDLPANGARTRSGGGVDAFVASFAPNGPQMLYCTYLGGTGDDRAFGLALDSSRNVYLTGWTSSANFPVVGGVQSKLSGTRDAFVAKLNAAGSAFVYSTYLGGSGVDTGNAIAVDSTGSAVILGDSTSSNLPVSSKAFQLKSGGVQDAFVAKLSATGNALNFLSYLGGSGVDHGSSVALDSSASIFLGGYTYSTNFPAVAAYQPRSGGGQDGFVAKMASDGSKMLFSTYLGGYGGSAGNPEQVNGIAVDLLGNVAAAGTTSSSNFPVTIGALQTVFGGQTDGFVARYTGQGQLLQSTFLGGSLSDVINAIAVDNHGNPYVTGSTASVDFPVNRPFQNSNAGALDAFVLKLATNLSSTIFGTYLGGSGSEAGNAIAVDVQTSIVIAGQTSSPDLPVKGVLASSPSAVLTSFVTKIAPSFTLATYQPYGTSLNIITDPWHVSWFVQNNFFGSWSDLPVVGDWDGTGIRRMGVFGNGRWLLDMNGNGVFDAADKTVLFGQTGDVPVVGDWAGTGRTSLGLFRQGTFILDLSGHISGVPTGQADAVFTFGQAGDVPVAGDWNGSGTTKIGIFRNGLWLVDYTGNRTFSNYRSYNYGLAGDIPLVGDWDSSGRISKIGVYRGGSWILDYDGDNSYTVPVVNEFILSFGNPAYKGLVF
jgi:hypothetical protein